MRIIKQDGLSHCLSDKSLSKLSFIFSIFTNQNEATGGYYEHRCKKLIKSD